VNQVKRDFEVREEMLQKYVNKAKELMKQFNEFEIMQILEAKTRKLMH
jgi:hypothetical protein